MKVKYYDVKKFDTIAEMLEIATKEAGDKHAFEYKIGNKYYNKTYKEFNEDVKALGTALAKINMTNKHVAVIGENSYKWVNVYLTMVSGDGVLVPIDKELTCIEIINVLKSSDSEVLFYSERYEKHIAAIKQEVPQIKYFIGFSKENDEENILSFEKFIEEGRKKYLQGDTSFTVRKRKNVNDLALLVYTSGTTGNPKGVMLSEHNLVSCVYYGLKVSTVYTKNLSVLPYHHTYELVAGLLISLHKHATICINDSLKNVLKNLQYYKPDYIYLVPAFAEVFYKNIWHTVDKEGKALALKILIVLSNILLKFGIDKRRILFKQLHETFGGNLRKIVVGGAALRNEVGNFFNSIGIPLINGYGITECSPLVSVNMDIGNDFRTVGYPLPCVEIKFENQTADGEGEICVKGDIVMLGYYKDEEATKRVLKDGWFNTEDYGKYNKKGQLIISGRKKNIIVLSNGKNIYPEEIECYIQKIPYVLEVVVKAVKDEYGQEAALCAEIYPNKEKLDEDKITNVEETLRQEVSKVTKDLPIYKRISKIQVRETEFNKTTTNKIKR